MKLLHNAKTLLTQPKIFQDYISYQTSRWKNQGQAIRILSDNLKVAGLSGFSEFHSCQNFLSSQEKSFFQTHTFEPGDLIDVGANLGVISLLLAQHFPTRKVHAFEANPFTFKALQHNIELNNCPNISPQNLAVAGHNGEIAFNADPIYRGTTSITKTFEQHTISVPCMALDTYAEKQSMQEIALLKVDVEGYEALVFEGAQNLLAQQKIQVIYYEVCPDMARKADLSPSAPTEMLLNHGYHIFRLKSDGALTLIEVSEIEQINCENWIALCP